MSRRHKLHMWNPLHSIVAVFGAIIEKNSLLIHARTEQNHNKNSLIIFMCVPSLNKGLFPSYILSYEENAFLHIVKMSIIYFES